MAAATSSNIPKYKTVPDTEYKFIERIEGDTRPVYLFMRLSDKKLIIFKSLNKKFYESFILKLLSSPSCNPYVICYYGTYDNFLLMEYFPGKTLNDFSFSLDSRRHTLELKLINIIVLQLLKGLAYIHSKNIVHGDIHGGNILIDPETHLIKYIDFEQSCYVGKNEHEIPLCDNINSSALFLSPEQVAFSTSGKPDIVTYEKTMAHDIWCLGVVINNLIWSGYNVNYTFAITSFFLYDRRHSHQVIEMFNQPIKLPPELKDDWLMKVLTTTLNKDSTKRDLQSLITANK